MPYFYHCRAMVTLYSAEAYEEAKLALISRLLADIDTVESAADKDLRKSAIYWINT